MALDDRIYEQIKRNFVYHPPRVGQPEVYEKLRDQGSVLAFLIAESAPDSRERSLAMTKLEEAIMWANAAIAREGQ